VAEKKKYNYGGQAVIEGVMIRGRTAVVTAIRRPSGDIAFDVKPAPSVQQSWARRTPFIRGVVVLIESMVLGIKSLMISANIALEEEQEQISNKAIFGMIAFAVVLAVGLFFIAPLFLTKLLDSYLPNSVAFTVIEGLIRIVIFLGYLKLIGMMKDIKLVFSYHGAEHKAVNGFEAGAPMEVDAIKPYSRAHIRCGTSFLFLVLLIAIIVFSLTGRQPLWIMVLSRIVLLPVIMGLGYEVIYLGARHTNNWFMKIILWPGLMLQAMTTGEPNDKQLEVGIAAIKKAVEIDRAEEAAAEVASAGVAAAAAAVESANAATGN
jgi:uncharacterized protein YqhQ